MPARLTTETWKEKAIKKHGEKYDYSLVEYKLQKVKVEIICPIHGNFFQTADAHLHYGCGRCGIEQRITVRSDSFDTFKLKANSVHNCKYSYPEQKYKNSRTKVKIICPEHGEFTKVSYHHIAGKGCNKCSGINKGLNSMIGIDEFIKRARVVHGDRYKYPGQYKGNHKNIAIKCRDHGIFKQIPHAHLRGSNCPKCWGAVSKEETELAEYIESLGFEVEQTKKGILNKNKSSLDIFIPELNIAIEYNGLYWHSEMYRKPDAHRKKYDECSKKGITLIQIFSDEWIHDKDKIKMRIKNLLGKGSIYDARKCEIRKPSIKESRTFLEKHHSQNAGVTLKYAHGLYFNNDMVAIVTFGKARFNNTGWELLRFASKGRVRGGLSRLIKAFIRENNPEKIVSYADLRWGSGDSYGAVGFVLDSITDPDYWWTDKIKRISRYKVQPHKTGMPEKEYAEKNGLVKIYGVGHKKWVWEKS